ncbi:MAG: DNA repair protein RecO [Cytophagales bacterium]|nr:DNA repair protein RecO [Cytophagales bacterium]
MLYKTSGIALSYIKYRETSIIARIFTETFGIQSYIVNSVRTKHAKTKIALFQPLTMLDLIVYHNKRKELNRISEVKCVYNFQTIPFDIRKSSIALFLTELLNYTLRAEEDNDVLFHFINESIITLDCLPFDFENFHLQFLLRLSRYLGIVPASGQSMLKEVGHAKVFDPEFAECIDFLLRSDYDQPFKMKKTVRHDVMYAILDHYRLHFDSIKEIKSIQVLREVLN